MKRRKFIILSAGGIIGAGMPLHANQVQVIQTANSDLYKLFRQPELKYHPFVRWWWNGNKVEAGELVRELRLLKNAGIGGVEINPVEFPSRSEGDDLGKPSLRWLSSDWMDMLSVVFEEAKALSMTCDLIVGSGWPFGGEFLETEKRSQIVVLAVKKVVGPIVYEISKYELFREADPAVSSPFPGRTMELLSLHLVPDPLNSIESAISISTGNGDENLKIKIPEGKHAIYGLVKISGFMQVINGVPGATGPVLDHYNEGAVKEYLNRMSEAIELHTGPLNENIRALFTDSMELEGANWSPGLREEFINRRGYDLFPWLPFILFKTGAMGNVTDFNYGVKMSPRLESDLARIRYDFELTKAELLTEKFIIPLTEWSRNLGVGSRAQAYGRSFFPLESSFYYDIPESESWTTNWLKHKVGEEMPEDDYRRGRAYTMINKYVSSAANLAGKREVSCEEMTDTYTVFNTTLELLKIGGDQSAITGVTHSVFHGFNYSPQEAPYPGWIRYGAYYNENNTWWPWFNLYNEYKGRLSSVFQNSDMFSDIAILPPVDDMWAKIGAQMEPFPSILHADYLSLVWEAMNKNGYGCDYVSQSVIRKAGIREGRLNYGPKKYHTLFLVNVENLKPDVAQQLLDFVSSGGRIFCIETIPSASCGWNDHIGNDIRVKAVVEKMKQFPGNFIYVRKPEKDFITWFRDLAEKYGIEPYLRFSKPDPFLMQIRRQTGEGSEIFFVIHSHIHKSHHTRLIFSREITRGRQGWLWDPVDGKRYRIKLGSDNGLDLELGPASSFLFVFDRNRGGEEWIPLPVSGTNQRELAGEWNAEFRHCHDGTVRHTVLETLKDLREMPEFVNFAGLVVYRKRFRIDDELPRFINLGKVWGVNTLKVNGTDCGAKWSGQRIYKIGEFLRKGENEIEIGIATSMGNYMKSLTDNPVAQYWTNEKNKIQPLQQMGLLGPVTLYDEN